MTIRAGYFVAAYQSALEVAAGDCVRIGSARFAREVAAIAGDLQAGEACGIYRTGDGYHIAGTVAQFAARGIARERLEIVARLESAA